MQLTNITGQIVSCTGNRWFLVDTEDYETLVLMVDDTRAIFVGLSDIGGCSSERTVIKDYIKDSYKILRSVK